MIATAIKNLYCECYLKVTWYLHKPFNERKLGRSSDTTNIINRFFTWAKSWDFSQWIEYLVLAYISQANSIFCAIWLVLRSRNILHHSPMSKTRWRPILFKLRNKKIVLNKRRRRARQYQKSNESWHVIIWRHVFLLLSSDKCIQDVFKLFCLQMMSGRQADVP